MFLIRRCGKCRKYLGVRLLNFRAWQMWFRETTGLCDKCFNEEITNFRKKRLDKIK